MKHFFTLSLCFLALFLSAQENCIGPDFNNDGEIGSADLIVFLSYYGNDWPESNTFVCGEDLNHQDYNYSTVQIGDQCWFSENCRYLPSVSSSSEESFIEPKYYVYNYEGTDAESAMATSNYETYGVLYNWPAIMNTNVCPSGWHIPTDQEWQTLEIYLGMSESDASYAGCCRGTDQGYQMKSSNVWGSLGNGSNSSGLTCIPGGYLGFWGSQWHQIITKGMFWSSTENNSECWYRSLEFSNDWVYRDSITKSFGLSARCVKD